MYARNFFSALAVSATLLGAAIPAAFAHEQADEARASQHFSAEQRAQWARTRLDHVANRLQITASQEPAWEAFANALLSLHPHHDKHPTADADAATLARFHADRAAERATLLAAVADATAKLQAVLNDNQQKILNQISHHKHHWHHGWAAWHEGDGTDDNR